jgi:hypothetical protein
MPNKAADEHQKKIAAMAIRIMTPSRRADRGICVAMWTTG